MSLMTTTRPKRRLTNPNLPPCKILRRNLTRFRMLLEGRGTKRVNSHE